MDGSVLLHGVEQGGQGARLILRACGVSGRSRYPPPPRASVTRPERQRGQRSLGRWPLRAHRRSPGRRPDHGDTRSRRLRWKLPIYWRRKLPHASYPLSPLAKRHVWLTKRRRAWRHHSGSPPQRRPHAARSALCRTNITLSLSSPIHPATRPRPRQGAPRLALPAKAVRLVSRVRS